MQVVATRTARAHAFVRGHDVAAPMSSEPIETWRVRSYPFGTHRTVYEAIAAAGTHPLQLRAERASTELAGRVLTKASWSDSEVRLAFSGHRLLHVAAASRFVDWRVEHASATTLEPGAFAADVDLEWDERDVRRFHRRAAWQQRIGAAFDHLFVTDAGLLLYCERRPILLFSAIRDLDRDRDVLHYEDLE